MTDKLKQIIQEETVKLPKETQEAINAFDWAKMTEEIGKKYFMDESEVNNLVVETLLVLIGLSDLDFYALNIENEVGTSKGEAEKIALEVVEKVFTLIGNKIEENVKKNLQNKEQDPEQNLEFILSGGDYSSFIENPSSGTRPIGEQEK